MTDILATPLAGQIEHGKTREVSAIADTEVDGTRSSFQDVIGEKVPTSKKIALPALSSSETAPDTESKPKDLNDEAPVPSSAPEIDLVELETAIPKLGLERVSDKAAEPPEMQQMLAKRSQYAVEDEPYSTRTADKKAVATNPSVIAPPALSPGKNSQGHVSTTGSIAQAQTPDTAKSAILSDQPSKHKLLAQHPGTAHAKPRSAIPGPTGDSVLATKSQLKTPAAAPSAPATVQQTMPIATQLNKKPSLPVVSNALSSKTFDQSAMPAQKGLPRNSKTTADAPLPVPTGQNRPAPPTTPQAFGSANLHLPLLHDLTFQQRADIVLGEHVSVVDPILRSNMGTAPQTLSPPTYLPHDAKPIAQQLAIHFNSQNGGTTVIRLNPEELGPVRMSLRNIDGIMAMTILAERPETAEIMRRNIGELAQEFHALGYENLTFDFDDRSNQAHDFRNSDGSREEITPELEDLISQQPVQSQITRDDRLDIRL